VVIVGGGIAGLSATRRLAARGVDDFVLLELEQTVGGNSRHGINEVSAFPWGAHYVPLPGDDAPEVGRLFEELGIIRGRDGRGLPIYREEYLCHDPVERLFMHGRWQEGLVPQLGLSSRERAQIDGFFARMHEIRQTRGADGRRAFTIPVDESSRDPAWLSLDRLTMAGWLDDQGWDSAPLRWYVDYCCRDDFGAGMDQVSAWAGVHYFASRHGKAANAPSSSVVTWPEGNGWLVEQLRKPVENRIRQGILVSRITPGGRQVEVEGYSVATRRTTRWLAESVIFAAPRFVAARVLNNVIRTDGLNYAPWMVANLTLDTLPEGRGADLAWDNVIYGSRSLGYVVATHQHLDPSPRRTVLTYYQPLDHLPPAKARKEASGRSHREWCDLILTDLGRAHPDLRRQLRRLDLMIWGHAMIRPEPGFMWGPSREKMTEPIGNVFFAHSDMSGMSLFEEAYIRGIRAADAALGP
jgi:hypothetical protein